jgi:hypothetical protein
VRKGERHYIHAVEIDIYIDRTMEKISYLECCRMFAVDDHNHGDRIIYSSDE